jgi:hypothetical protein
MDNTIDLSDFYMDQIVNKENLYSKKEKYKINMNITATELMKHMNQIFDFNHMLFIYKSNKPI